MCSQAALVCGVSNQLNYSVIFTVHNSQLWLQPA